MDGKEKQDYQLYYHKLQLIEVMKKIPKIVKNTNKPPASPSVVGNVLNYLTLGLIAGFVFQGSYIFLGFENRVIKGVTANRLQEIKKIDKDVHDSIAKGEKPKVNLDWLRSSWKAKIQKQQNLSDNKK